MDKNLFQGMVQQQKLIPTAEIQQMLKILQMPLYELQQDIAGELDMNPLLEVIEDENTEECRDTFYEDYYMDMDKFLTDKEMVCGEYAINIKDSSEKNDPFNLVIAKKTLKDYLFEQLLDLDENEIAVSICRYIIESIDERGYLSCTVEEIAEDLMIPVKLAEHALKLVQNFQPFGVAARDIRECLKIQLRQKNIRDENVYRLVDECLELIANNKIKEISVSLGLNTGKVNEYCSIIRSLEPKPSRGFYTGNPENYILPEASIRKLGSDYHILMNDNVLPKLVVNQMYKDVIKNQGDEQAVSFVKEKVNRALCLIRGIEQRKRTIYNILEKIVELQREYFDRGEKFLKPMTIKDVASELGIHESTISRAIRDKYINTPINIIKIRDLFTTSIGSKESNKNVSSRFVKNELKKLIDNEDKADPLSDQDICMLLKKNKIDISRRTVAKYREEMNIPSSGKRKGHKIF